MNSNVALWSYVDNCYHIYSSQATIFYFSDTVHFSARSLTYEMLRWAFLMDHFCISGLLYVPMLGLSLRTLRFEDRCSHLVITEQLLMAIFISVISHCTDGVSDGLYCMDMSQYFIWCCGYYCSYIDSYDIYWLVVSWSGLGCILYYVLMSLLWL